jgi:membrane protein YdbS with pleckstrin-like domain
MMSGMPLELYWAFNKLWNNKFYYKVASCWLFQMIHTTMRESRNILKKWLYEFESQVIDVEAGLLMEHAALWALW